MPPSVDLHRHSSGPPALASAGLGLLLVLSIGAQEAARQPHGELKIECDACHTLERWTPLRHPLRFRHDATGFALVGAHSASACRGCHADLIFSNAAGDCFSCHQADFDDAVVPNHTGLPTTCDECHRETAWETADFIHTQTGFPLLGAHTNAECEDCHIEDYAGTPIDCFSCHQADFEGAVPDHQEFPITCEECHNESAWGAAIFNHSESGFPLRGAHAVAACEDCHTGGFTGAPSDCFSCHQADFEGATEPDHRAFPVTCEDCHGETAWEPAIFDHAAFPLLGAHAVAACEDCHAAGYAGTPRDCFSCHRADFEGATDPDHGGFPTTCEECHGQTSWDSADFNHAQSGFPLRGAHAAADCQDCHAGGYAGTPSDCFACHQADFQGADDPDHQGFPTTCEDCHGETAWEPADFDHNQTAFPLDGSHRGLSCQACHRGGYAGTPTDCYACHQADYDAANDPDHLAAGFPTTCQDCHNTSDWDDADWDHDDYFPIYSGNHRREWNACEDCHVSPGNFARFECVFCHEHEQGRTDREHDEVRSYRYESQACYNCHPDGRE